MPQTVLLQFRNLVSPKCGERKRKHCALVSFFPQFSSQITHPRPPPKGNKKVASLSLSAAVSSLQGCWVEEPKVEFTNIDKFVLSQKNCHHHAFIWSQAKT
jgi:hypothetical protein